MGPVQRIKQKLANGERVFGTFIVYAIHPAVVEILPDEGLDFVILNTEHNALHMADFVALRHALRAKGIAALLRVDTQDPWDAAKACDTFDGVVVPYAEDVELLKRIAAAAVFRPLKGDALERLITTGEWPSEKTKAYVENKCADTLFVPMIESARAVADLDAICSVPGIDAVFVGPNDLSMTMGIPEERDNPEFIAIIQKIIDTAEKHGIAAGAHYSKIEHAKRLVAQGARFIPYSSDLRLIQFGIPSFLEELSGRASGGEEKII